MTQKWIKLVLAEYSKD